MVDDGGQREVRLALVMTGGVSLAVWMGGVAAELYRATQAEGLYGRLQRATATTLTIDVIAGASAGGLNGAFLGMALARRTSSGHFDKVRDLWLEVGSFDLLMRNPWHPNPPSLLRGDDYFMVEMQKLLRGWPAAGARDGAGGRSAGAEGDEGGEGPTVVLTCSLLSPDRRGYEDDFGTRIDEPVHRGRFRFTGDALARGGVDTDRLALAARTSASFPGAFEPSFVPIGEGSPERPDMASVADFRRSRWAVDGGVLLNKPVGPALDLISQRASDREVRRILAYVNPDPGASPSDVADRIGEMPPLGSVVLDSLVTLPRTETIAADLDDIRRHNRRMVSQSRSRLSLLTDPALVGDDGDGDGDRRAADPAPLVTLARRVYPVWLRKRTEWSIDRRLAAHYERRGLGPTSSVSPGGTFGYAELRDAMVQVRADFGWGDAAFPDLTRGDVDRWGFGFHPLEYATTVALDLIRRAYALLPAAPPPPEPDGVDEEGAGDAPATAADAAVEGARTALGACRLDVHEQRRWLRALRVADSDYWASALARVEGGRNAVVAGSRRQQTLETARLLHAEWLHPLRAYRPRAADTTPGPAERDRLWAWVTTDVLATGAPDPSELLSPDDPTTPRRYEGLVERARGFTAADIAARAEQIRKNELELARRLARILRELAAPIRAAIAAQAARREGMDPEVEARRAPDDREHDVAPALRPPARDEQLRRMAGGLGLGSTTETILERLLALYVVHMTTEDGFAEDEVRIELLQVSANTPSPLDPNRTTAATKLAGLQLGHFGAFLKESWRANDWMWGTLDGSANVVLLLLEPARLRQRFTRADDAVEALRKVACTAEAGDPTWTAADAAWFETQVWARRAAEMTEELRFVDDPDAPLPSRLPVTTSVLTEAVQLAVARRELPVVKDAVERTTASGGGEPRGASIFVGQMRAAAAAAGASGGGPASIAPGAVRGLLGACAVGQERSTDEMGTDAGAALAARAAAVATGVASGSRSGLGKLRHAVQPVRAASLGVHLLAASAARQSRAGFAATTVLLAIGAGAVAAKLLGGNVPDAVLVVALVALAAWVAFTGFTVGVRLVCLPVAALVGVVALSYIEPDRVCPVFAARCGPGQPQPEWKDPLTAVVPAVLAIAAAGLLVLGLWRYGSARRWRAATAIRRFAAGYDTTAVTAAPGPKARRTLVSGLATLVVAVAYPLWLHDALFEQRAGSPWIDTVAWLARNQALVALLVLPLAFIALGYARTAALHLRRLAARRRAARAMTATLT